MGAKIIRAAILLSFVMMTFSLFFFHEKYLHSTPLMGGPDETKPDNNTKNTKTRVELPTADSVDSGDDCFSARGDTIHKSRFGKLRPPFVNLGFPKIGSTSLHALFACAGYRSMHFRCKKDKKCSECIQESVNEGLPPFGKCDYAESYSQLDDGSWGHFPQVEYLQQLVNEFADNQGFPQNGTFLLLHRNMSKWYRSLTNWPPGNEPGSHMSDGLMLADITGFPAGRGRNEKEFSDWFCSHVKRVREVVDGHPSHSLVEINIDDPGAGDLITDIFDINPTCWGHRNANVLKGNGTSSTDLPWFVRGKAMIQGKTRLRRRQIDPLPILPGMSPELIEQIRSINEEILNQSSSEYNHESNN